MIRNKFFRKLRTEKLPRKSNDNWKNKKGGKQKESNKKRLQLKLKPRQKLKLSKKQRLKLLRLLRKQSKKNKKRKLLKHKKQKLLKQQLLLRSRRQNLT